MATGPIQVDQWVLLQLPNEKTRLLQLRADQMVDVGKYGKFKTSQLFGRPYGFCYDINPKTGELAQLDESSFAAIGEKNSDGENDNDGAPDVMATTRKIATDGEMATNQEIVDSNTSQKLSYEDIARLKSDFEQGVTTPQAIVSTLVANSETFDKKNTFSKVKYIQRKQRKFLRWVKIIRPTTRTLTEHFFQREPYKIMDLRLDTLSQLLNIAAIQAGGRYLVWDDTKGLLLGAMLSRLGQGNDSGTIVALHEGQQFQPPFLAYFNYSQEQADKILPLALEDVSPATLAIPEFVVYTEETQEQRDRVKARRNRFDTKQARRLQARALVDEQAFDAVIIASQKYTPASMMAQWLPLVKSSGRLVIYSSELAPLMSAFDTALHSEGLVDVSLSESWLRPYQVEPGRIHPNMTISSHGGFLFSATRVI